MLASKCHIVTYREDSSEAEIVSHKVLLRAGFIVKLGSGLYAYSPLIWKVMRKIERIIREEMDKAGALELQVPILQPVEFWEESGRLEVYKANGTMLFTRDRNESEFGLAPTAEEMVTAFVKSTVQSYKQLPLCLYQIHTKMRDEIRPRFGLLRVKEFIMKDAYSFDSSKERMENAYKLMRETYFRIFSKLGLESIAVDADSGDIGGSGSSEFIIIANSGEDKILIETGTEYAANIEKAVSQLVPPSNKDDEFKILEIKDTPNIRTCDQLSKFFSDFPIQQMVKTILYKVTYRDNESYVAVLMRGDKEINETKLKNHLKAIAVKLLSGEEIQGLTGAEMGFAGPIQLNPVIRILADESVRSLKNVICGINQNNKHAINANIFRDFNPAEFADFRLASEGEPGPVNGNPLLLKKGIEVGHIFQLGTKYSNAMKAVFIDSSSNQIPYYMGCYGIGVSRLVAAAIEQKYTPDGSFHWPVAISPFEVAITCLIKDQNGLDFAKRMYDELRNLGIDILFDDREISVGVKLKDLELIGIPIIILIGKKWKDEGLIEVKNRIDHTVLFFKPPELPEKLKSILSGNNSKAGD
ncbi:MAG: proline--tRNA ligase [Candidatus Riflebacteria bacterium]|nr:proline--tRNA ligase [Candidatus Riflebacteria bacterium]